MSVTSAPPSEGTQGDEQVIAAVRRWIETMVVGLNLCPFARREMEAGRVRYHVSDADTPQALLCDLSDECARLLNDESIETTLLIHPGTLPDFYDYNDFLAECNAFLARERLEGVFQLASFHPDYQFADTHPDDPENYSNRAPFPLLHILREESVSRAVATHPDVESIPQRNVALLRALGAEQLAQLRAGITREVLPPNS